MGKPANLEKFQKQAQEKAAKAGRPEKAEKVNYIVTVDGVENNVANGGELKDFFLENLSDGVERTVSVKTVERPEETEEAPEEEVSEEPAAEETQA